MRQTIYLPALCALIAYPAFAQFPEPRTRQFRQLIETTRGDEAPRAVIGIGTAAGVSPRDTIGLLVTTVTPNGPAETAGIEEGDRLQSVAGANLRLARADVDDPDMRGIMQRRLERELGKLKPGDAVELGVYSGGRSRTVRVKTVSSDSLYPRERLASDRLFRADEDRASLGFSIGATGSKRDTLGVFVFSVNDSGPAARAGVEEGSRIAAIGNVDLRVAPADAGDEFAGSARVRRLQREIGRLKAGDDVELRVYTNGQYRTVHLKAAKASDLRRRGMNVFITGDGASGSFMIPPMPPMPPMGPMPPMNLRLPRIQLNFDGPELSDMINGTVDRAMHDVDRAVREAERARRAVRVTVDS